MKLLGVDYGLRRIGLAISEGTMSHPIGKVGNLAGVARIAGEHGIDKIIVGLPGMNNPKITGFGDRLGEITGLPVEYWDEGFSTRQARSEMISAGVPTKARRDSIDQTAAAVILQSYLDAHKEERLV